MWTVGRPGLGENPTKPAVFQALEVMIASIMKNQKTVVPQAVLPPRMYAPLKTTLWIPKEMECELLLTRLVVPNTVAITTLPRESTSPDRNTVPSPEEKSNNPLQKEWMFQNAPLSNPAHFSPWKSPTTTSGHNTRSSTDRESFVSDMDTAAIRSNVYSTHSTAVPDSDSGWQHFAGCISRLQAETLLQYVESIYLIPDDV